MEDNISTDWWEWGGGEDGFGMIQVHSIYYAPPDLSGGGAQVESCGVAVNTDEALITSLSLAFCGEAWFPNRPYTQGVGTPALRE